MNKTLKQRLTSGLIGVLGGAALTLYVQNIANHLEQASAVDDELTSKNEELDRITRGWYRPDESPLKLCEHYLEVRRDANDLERRLKEQKRKAFFII